MRKFLFMACLAISQISFAGEVTFRLSEIDRTLDSIGAHAKQYPLRFESKAQREQIEQSLKQMLEFLDAASAEYPDNPAILFRQAFANGMGHNLDFPGCAEKAIEAYERVIDIEPENQRANYYYGAFLSGTTLFKKSIPYLEKAIQLGETDAHYTLAFVYIKLGNPKMALPEFKAYLVSDPDNRTAKKMVSEIESNTLSTQFHETPPLNGGVIYESSSIQPSK